ncbi:MAG TPA: SO_0444 family Cu/Zn efflux transporter [Xanthobacteraceae bacterium]|nr:SO_0444 family Cu/Zn efflux transporter [Xanthobacteraceae bacterium]
MVGFLFAGMLAVLVPGTLLTRLAGTGKVRSVLWASILGAPLPLCSCGVLPTALGLRKQGATPGATVAFMVATPETGVDSISLTYALTDPIMTVFRPIAGVVTAIAAGLATNLFSTLGSRNTAGAHPRAAYGSAGEPNQNSDDVREFDHEASHHQHHGHDHSPDAMPLDSSGSQLHKAAYATSRIIHYGFVELFDDIAWWLALGIVLSAVAEIAIPADLFADIWGGDITSMLLMLVLSIPLYTCASSSTPLAAALVLKGLSPGAALVFLLAGPTTNIGSVVVLLKVLGRRAVAVYLIAVAIVTVAAGLALNELYSIGGFDPRATFGTAAQFVPTTAKTVAAVLLAGLLIASMLRTRIPDEWVWLRDRIAERSGISITARGVASAGAAFATLLWLGSGFFAVSPGDVGIRLRFGRVIASDLPPGLHFRLPWPVESHLLIARSRVRRIEFGLAPGLSRVAATRAQIRGRPAFGASPAPDQTIGVWFQKETAAEDASLLTGDANLIDLKSAVQYRVKDALAFAYNIAEPDTLVKGTILSALRAVVATHAIDAIYTSAREEIERSTRQAAQAMLDRYQAGIDILTLRLLYVHPPDAVHDAFRDVASAQEDKLRTINLANVFAVEKINAAKAEAAAMTEGSLAYKEQRIKAARGDAAAFALRLEAYKHAPELTKFRLQIETLEDVLPSVRKFVRPSTGDVRDVDMWLLQPFSGGPGK